MNADADTPDHRRERGQVTAFVVVFTAALILLAGLVIDGGLALSARLHALNEAQAAARSGAQQLDLAVYRRTGAVRLDPGQARAAARDYLATLNTDATVRVAGDTVTVTVRTTQPTQILQVAGIDTFHVSATANASAVRGVTEPVP